MKTTILIMKIMTISFVILGFGLIVGSLLYIPKDLISAHIAGETSLANAIGAIGGVMVWLGIASLFLTMAIAFNAMKDKAEKKTVYWVLIILMILLMMSPFTAGLLAVGGIKYAYNFYLLCGADNIIVAYDKAVSLPVSEWIFAFVACFFIFIIVSRIPWIFQKNKS